MASLARRIQVAANAAINAWAMAFREPSGTSVGDVQSERNKRYDYLDMWYDGSVLMQGSSFSASLRRDFRLYRQTRLLVNHFTRVVDFWSGIIYPGVLSKDGKPLPGNVPLGIPLASDVSPEMRAAIAQLWVWGGWQAQKSIIPHKGAKYGNVLVEVFDDTEREVVTPLVRPPSMVSDLRLNAAGDVLAYALQYRVWDAAKEQFFTFRKVVDRYTFRYFYDGDPYDPDGNGPIQENPYGFCPAVWYIHRNIGSPWGVPAIGASLPKLLELNSLLSHIHDQIHKKINAPRAIYTSASIKNLLAAGGSSTAKRTETDDLGVPDEDRESMLMLKIDDHEGHSEDLSNDLPLDGAYQFMQRLIEEIEAGHPEILIYDRLRSMGQIAFDTALALVGDVTIPVHEIRAGYDYNTVKWLQMATSIGGWRYNQDGPGKWKRGTVMQAAFKPFNLDSYAAGLENFDIDIRPVVPTPPMTQTELVALAATMAEKLGVPIDWVLVNVLGKTQADLDAMNLMSGGSLREAAVADAMMAEQSTQSGSEGVANAGN